MIQDKVQQKNQRKERNQRKIKIGREKITQKQKQQMQSIRQKKNTRAHQVQQQMVQAHHTQLICQYVQQENHQHVLHQLFSLKWHAMIAMTITTTQILKTSTRPNIENNQNHNDLMLSATQARHTITPTTAKWKEHPQIVH